MDTQQASTQCMLTTVDNPFDPFDQWDDWYAYDSHKGYHSPSLLARVVFLSDEMTDDERGLTIEMAIDEIVRENVSGMHKKVTRDDSKNEVGDSLEASDEEDDE